MTDLARLGIEIDSTSANAAVGDLDKLTAAGTRAETAVDRLGDEAAQTGTQVKGASAAAAEYAADIQRMATNTRLAGTHVDRLGTSTRNVRAHMTNLSFQLQDVGVQLASGANPFMVMAQQGSQVVGIFQQAGDSAGALAYRVGVLIGRFLPLGIAIGTAYAAIKLFQSELNDKAPADQFIASLGLTEKEMKELGDTAITTGDLFTGLWKVIAERSGVDESIADFKTFIVTKFGEALDGAGKAIAAIYGETVGTYRAITKVWDDLPAMFQATFARAVNAAAEKLESFINGVIGGINRIASEANALLGTKLFGQIGPVALGRVEADFSKSFGNIRGIIRGNIESATSEAQGYIDELVADVGRAATDARNARLRAQAAGIIADRTNKAADAHRNNANAADEETAALERLAKARIKFGGPAKVGSDLLNGPALATGSPDFGGISAAIDHTLLDGANALLETLREIADQSQVTAQIMADSFGNAGAVFGGIVADMAGYQEARQQLTIEVVKGNKTQEQADKILHSLQVRNTGAAIAGLKSLFKEHSTGYKVMAAVEKAFAVFQAVQTAAAIARDISHTASAVANSAARATAAGTEGVANQSKLPFPLNLVAMAATAAALIAAGVAVFGGGGGGASSAPESAEDLQAAAGTGTVLGDAKAKSQSIAHSLELVADNTNKDLEYSNAMLAALRNIDTSIAKMAGTVARQVSVSGSLFDTSGLNLGTNSSGGFLGLFGSTTTKSLFDLGIELGSASVASIIANGVSGNSFQTVEKVKHKSGFLGIGGGTKTSYTTTTGALDPEISGAIQSVILSLRDGLVAAANVIGLDGAKAMLDSFTISIGKISFKDLSGAEIEDQLNAIFSSIGDQMAGTLLPSLRSLQQVGEGLFETFIRVAKEYEAVDIALKSIGREFGAVGVQSLAARDALVQLFGSLDQFIESTNFFRDNFLSEAEQVAPVQQSVIAEMQRLGLAGVTTREQFKDVVLGLDLTTEAGRQMYASLLAVAPAFDKVLDYFDEINSKAAQSLQSTVDQFTKFADSLAKYRDTLFATDQAQGNAYALLKARFIATASLAAQGDASALGGLEQSGKDFLTAAKNNASTLQDYQRDVALVARGVDKGIFAAEETADYAQLQLDALKNATSILQQIADNTAPVPAPPATGVQTVPSNETSVPVVEEQNQTIIDQNARIIDLLTQQQRLWTRFEGDGLIVKTDSDTPLNIVSV